MQHLEFHVEIWSADGQRVEELVSASSNVLVARAAFDRMVKYRPDVPIALRHRTHVIKEHKPAIAS